MKSEWLSDYYTDYCNKWDIINFSMIAHILAA